MIDTQWSFSEDFTYNDALKKEIISKERMGIVYPTKKRIHSLSDILIRNEFDLSIYYLSQYECSLRESIRNRLIDIFSVVHKKNKKNNIFGVNSKEIFSVVSVGIKKTTLFFLFFYYNKPISNYKIVFVPEFEEKENATTFRVISNFCKKIIDNASLNNFNMIKNDELKKPYCKISNIVESIIQKKFERQLQDGLIERFSEDINSIAITSDDEGN